MHVKRTDQEAHHHHKERADFRDESKFKIGSSCKENQWKTRAKIRHLIICKQVWQIEETQIWNLFNFWSENFSLVCNLVVKSLKVNRKSLLRTIRNLDPTWFIPICFIESPLFFAPGILHAKNLLVRLVSSFFLCQVRRPTSTNTTSAPTAKA